MNAMFRGDGAPAIEQAKPTFIRYSNYPGLQNNRILRSLDTVRKNVIWMRGIVAVRIRAYGTAGDRIRMVFDALNDAMADAYLQEPNSANTSDVTVLYNELVVGDGWESYEFVEPGIRRIDFVGTANPSDIFVEAWEMI